MFTCIRFCEGAQAFMRSHLYGIYAFGQFKCDGVSYCGFYLLECADHFDIGLRASD